jgi:pimeloyl-ACP methyl ester carboxylesterase
VAGAQVILLPGGVLPAELAYSALADALRPSVAAALKDLEVYAADSPPPGYGLATEVDGLLRFADDLGIDRFHLGGYSAGGAAALAFAAAHPARLASLTLLEPAWAGSDGVDAAEAAVMRDFDRIMGLPEGELMPAFVRAQLAPGVEPPAPPPGPPPPWMAKRPAGLRAITRAFAGHDLDMEALSRFEQPVLYVLGGLSNPDLYGRRADRLGAVFPDYTVEVYADRHHFDPPHRTEPERVAEGVRRLIERSDGG